MGVVISFLNNKGGVGKTTSAVSIGRAWAAMGRKVLFIDLDSQANMTSIISGTDTSSQKWNRTLEDAVREGAGSELPVIHTDDPYVDYVPTDLDLSNFEKETQINNLRLYLLQDLIAPLKDDYEFIILDCPPSLSSITYNAMIASDYLVLVTNPEGTSYKGMNMILSLYNEIINNPRYNPNLKVIGCLITRVEKDKVSGFFIDKIMESFGQLVVEPFIPKATKVPQATSVNQTIYEIDPNGKVANAYREVSKEILVRIVDDQRGE